ncbi:MAG: c-type cytochrome domain-containing protein, partial [Novipirellula sp. JB048]
MSVVEPRRFATLTLLCAVASLAWGEDPSGPDPPVRFNLDVRPILSENCFPCHGFDEAARQADLRLDTESGAKAYAIEPGEASQSDLYLRIISDDPE